MSGSLEPDRGPVSTELRPVDIAVAISAALLAAALIAAAAIALRNARRRWRGAGIGAGRAGPPEPPETALLREVERLRGEIDTLRRDHFYEQLSFAVRRYAEAVTGVPALDRTTQELGSELAKRGGVDPEGIALLLRTLRGSDLAKFARLEDPSEEARATLEEAASIAGRLAQPPKPPDPPEPPPTPPAPPDSPERPAGAGSGAG